MEVLTVSHALSRDLMILDNESEGIVVKVCKHFLQKLLVNSSTVSIDEKLIPAMKALGTLYLEAVKTRTSDSTLKSVLQEQGLQPQTIEILLAFYEQQLPTMTQHLAKIGIDFAQVVGVDWRLDHDIKSRSAGKDGVPVFYVTLQVIERGEQRPIHFTASLEELQDLLSKVRDAVKEVDRVLVAINSN